MTTLFEKRQAYLKEQEDLKNKKAKIVYTQIEAYLRSILIRKDFNELLEDTLIKNGYTEFAIKLEHEECDYIDYQLVKERLADIIEDYRNKGIFIDIMFKTVYFALIPDEVEPQFYFNKFTPTISILHNEADDNFILRNGQAYSLF